MSDHPNCPFCTKTYDLVVGNDLAYALYDSSPVSPGHCLIVPYRHVAEYFDVTDDERAAIWAVADEMKVLIDEEFNPDGYNMGVNVGESAGQSVPHVHIHMIPRFKGDMDNPRGGVRGVIPHKQKYAQK
jgi:diadenosine tetraphosphate (Ap4A) HIT family hydrolase